MKVLIPNWHSLPLPPKLSESAHPHRGLPPPPSQEEAVCTLKAPSRAALPSRGICEVDHFCVTWQI